MLIFVTNIVCYNHFDKSDVATAELVGSALVVCQNKLLILQP